MTQAVRSQKQGRTVSNPAFTMKAVNTRPMIAKMLKKIVAQPLPAEEFVPGDMMTFIA